MQYIVKLSACAPREVIEPGIFFAFEADKVNRDVIVRGIPQT
ncbi:unnamed protein product, partial [marine sediment metagenome]